MANDPILSPDGPLTITLANLRGLNYVGPAASGQNIVPGVFFSLDPETDNTVQVTSRSGELMDIRMEVARPGRWLALNLVVGGADLAGRKIVGFACTSDAREPTTFRVCLRSGTEGGHRDLFFPKTVMTDATTSLHLDVLELGSHPNIPVKAPWRDLVIFFQCKSAEIALRDFRLIVI
jgi:hypothetical protein